MLSLLIFPVPEELCFSIQLGFQLQVLFWFLLCPTLAPTSADIALVPREMYHLTRDCGCCHQPRQEERTMETRRYRHHFCLLPAI